MALVSTLTIGSNTYSVYALTADPVGDGDEYFAARLGASAWTASTVSTTDKKKALVSAVRFIDRAVNWSGAQTSSSQALEWPRDGASCDGIAVTDGTTPDDFATATFEMALVLLGDATVQDGTGTGSNVKRVKAGPAEVEFFTPTLDPEFSTRLPTVVHDLIGCYVQAATGLGSTSYGTTDDDGKSQFDCDDHYNLNQGLP